MCVYIFEKFTVFFMNGEMYTLMLNTDGIQLFEISKVSLWPILLVLNKLPMDIRFNIDNVIIAGKYFPTLKFRI
jgi:hypothetical protein